MFLVKDIEGSIVDTEHGKRKWKNHDGGRQTGNTYLLRYDTYHKSIAASITPRNEMSTASPHFWGRGSQWMALLRILCYLTGSRLFKLAAAKPEVLIPQLLDKIANTVHLKTRCYNGGIAP